MISSNLAIVFPGQGSQSVGMLMDIAGQYPEVEQIFAEASHVLGYDLWHLVTHGPAEELDKTMHTQPALLAASYAIWQILYAKHQLKPAALAGHSLGEYTALVCAQALQFTDAIKLVAARGKYMQEAVAPGEGAMAAIVGLSDEAVTAICQQIATSSEDVLSPANFNSIGQVVVAGHKALVERAIILAKEQGAKLAMLIPVSVPSHCQLMLPAANRLAELLETITFKSPSIPVINNVNVEYYIDATSIRNGLVKQLYRPVRWVNIIQHFLGANITQIIECGPGKVLTGLNKRIDKSLQLMTTADMANLNLVLNIEMRGKKSNVS